MTHRGREARDAPPKALAVWRPRVETAARLRSTRVFAPHEAARRGPCYVLPVTVKWARRFRCQHSSFDCVQTGTSLP